ncbi:MAG: Maf family protein [Lachnospiraceae bacterium]|nr:Maf family protein [Lachnospiraceae bacterium]
MTKRHIILASASPRRRELMLQIGMHFDIATSDKEEELDETDPEKVCLLQASVKAADVAARMKETYPGEKLLVIGADTVVAAGGQILGKPGDKEKARTMLESLSGKVHQVYTGVCVIRVPEMTQHSFAECTDVAVSDLSAEAIEDYLATGEPFDKAGAYGIQGYFARYITRISGDYNNVVGLPVGRLYRECLADD